MSTQEYVKYLTQTILRQMELPKAERKQMKLERRLSRPPILDRWFGLVPFSLKMAFKRRGSR
ncbi:MAG TPA: YqzE family protein [Bacillaceae bacterium]